MRQARNEGGDIEAAGKTFDCKFSRITSREPYMIKDIFKIEGLKLDRSCEYDVEGHIFTATIDESQTPERLMDNIDCLNSVMNDYLDFLV